MTIYRGAQTVSIKRGPRLLPEINKPLNITDTLVLRSNELQYPVELSRNVEIL